MVKKQQYILVKIGDKDHPPSEEQLQRTANILRDSILKKKKIITFPYWVDISFVNAKPKSAFVVKHEEPIYCEDCEYYDMIDDENSEQHEWERCRCPVTIKTMPTYKRKLRVGGNCEKLNKDNNCPYYKKKSIWRQILLR